MERTLLIRNNWHDRDESKWLFWLEKKLTELGFAVSLADLPNAAKKDTEHVVAEIQNIHGILPHNTLVVRHDPGCLTLLKYCEQLLLKNTMEPTLLVAGIPKRNAPSASVLKMLDTNHTYLADYNPGPDNLSLQTMDIKLVVVYGGQLVKALPQR